MMRLALHPALNLAEVTIRIMISPIGNELGLEPNRLIAAVGGRKVASAPGSLAPSGIGENGAGYEGRTFPDPVGKSSLTPAEQAELDRLLGVDEATQQVAGAPGTDGAAGQPAASATDETQLTEEEQEQVEKMRARDQEVRAHEQAHLSAAGPYARGGVHLEYEQGPDGRRYAVAGHVDIDMSPIPGDPEATIQKMQVVRQAANAPAQPSDADRAVAAEAAQIEAKARAELFESQVSGEGSGNGALASAFSTTGVDRPFEPGKFIDVYG